MVLMSIETYEKREQLLEMRAKVLRAEEERISGGQGCSISEARKMLQDRTEKGSFRE